MDIPRPSRDSADRDPTHLGAVAILGSPLPRNRQRWVFLAVKSAAACLVALAADRLTGNPDHVTSTFVAVLCVSPVVLMGLRRSLDQVAGSLIGGTAGTLAALALPGPFLGIPLAVGTAILLSFVLGFGRGYTVAAFSALFVQAVPRGTPLDTLEIRLIAVATGAAAAFVVNVLVSSTAYRGIFRRRMRFAEATVSALLVKAAEQGPRVVQAGFPALAELERELTQARDELRWRRSAASRQWIEGLCDRTASLRRLLHLVLDLVYRIEEEELPEDAVQEWLRWLVREGGSEPALPEALIATALRIRRLGRTLRLAAL
ncbi:MAG: aromatic acid exporter family protein [Thermoanaerobaculia bacterium]